MATGLALICVGWFWFYKQYGSLTLATVCIVIGSIWTGFALDSTVGQIRDRFLLKIHNTTVEQDEVQELARRRAAEHGD